MLVSILVVYYSCLFYGLLNGKWDLCIADREFANLAMNWFYFLQQSLLLIFFSFREKDSSFCVGAHVSLLELMFH